MKNIMISKTLFVLLCTFLAASAAMAADDCTGDLWPADINGDCHVQYEDFAILSDNWGEAPPAPYLDLDGIIHIEAESTILGGAYKIDSGPDSVIVSFDGTSHINSVGTASFTMPAEIPAGEYALRVRWQALNQGGVENGAFNISGVTENGGNSDPGAWHSFGPPAGTSGFFMDELAGPSMGVGATSMINGWEVQDGWGAFATSLTIAAGNNGNITIEIMDASATPNYALFIVDYFEFVPIIIPPDLAIYIQAEDCILGGAYKIDSGPDSVIVASDGAAHINATGTVSFTMPAEIPAGEYELSVRWQALNQGGVENGAFNISGVTENGGNSDPGAWHSFGPPAGTSGFFMDELAGPSMGVGATSMINGWEVQDGWGAFATSLTIAAGNNGNVTIEIMDASATPNYALFIIDYFEFEEIAAIPEPATMCLLSLGGFAMLRRSRK